MSEGMYRAVKAIALLALATVAVLLVLNNRYQFEAHQGRAAHRFDRWTGETEWLVGEESYPVVRPVDSD